MKVIISPAKQMKVDTDTFVCEELPVFGRVDRRLFVVYGHHDWRGYIFRATIVLRGVNDRRQIQLV